MARRREDTDDSQVPVEVDNDILSSISPSAFHIQRPLYFAILFLSLTILVDATYTILFRGRTTGGPLQSVAEFIIPQLVIRYPTTPRLFANEDIGIDGKICPPDGFLDRALLLSQSSAASQGKNGVTYSSDFDPRNTKSKPSSFPHCELKKWVNLHEHNNHQKQLHQGNNDDSNNKGASRKCPKGEEYVTHIYPKQFSSSSSQQQRKKGTTTSKNNNNQNVKIIHIATPTNCLPTSKISSLQSFTEYYYNISNPQIIISIYIHSQEAMDAFLYQRVWNVFPEVKEGLLCGMAKVRFVVKKVMDELLLQGDTKKASLDKKEQLRKKDNIANEIATLAKRDIWRYLILWEFGGTVIDWEVLQSLIDFKTLSGPTGGVTTTDMNPLINVARQWFASEWFGKSFGTNAGDSSSINSQEDGDAIITMMDGHDGKQPVPLTGVMTASPNHPLMYFSAKWALRSMIDDNYLVWGESPNFRAFNALGRNTDRAAVQEGLNNVMGKDWEMKSKQIGNANLCDVDKTKSIRFLKGRGIFPKSLASPMQDMISIVKKHMDDKSDLPTDDAIIVKSFQGMDANLENQHKEDKTYVSKPDPVMFSCMEYRLQVYTNNDLVQQ